MQSSRIPDIRPVKKGREDASGKDAAGSPSASFVPFAGTVARPRQDKNGDAATARSSLMPHRRAEGIP